MAIQKSRIQKSLVYSLCHMYSRLRVNNVSYQSEGCKLYTARNVSLIGYYGIAIQSPGVLITKLFAKPQSLAKIISQHYSIGSFFSAMLTPFKNKVHSNKKITYDNIFHLVARHGPDIDTPNYAHWMLENLPLIHCYLKQPQDTKLLIRASAPAWIYETLTTLGVCKDKIVEAGSDIYCRNLIFCDLPYIHSNEYIHCKVHRHWLSKAMKSKCIVNKKEKNRRIFLSRQTSRRRKIQNFDEFEKLMQEFGIDVIDTSAHTVCQQVAIFHNSAFVLSQSGAALSNMLFMNKGAKVMEIKNVEKNSSTWCWEELAKEMGHRYYSYDISTDAGRHSDILIDIDILKSELKKVLS